jgi:Xaa-Pro aminopeptidase
MSMKQNLEKASTSSSTIISNLSMKSRLDSLREHMMEECIDAFIIPTDDPHMSEYCASYYARREYISGFTGSAGTAIVTQKEALLFTDGRYHNQASIELDAQYWTLMRQGVQGVPSIQDWLISSLKSTNTIGIDPSVHAASVILKLKNNLLKNGINIKMLKSDNLVDKIWNHDNRPSAPQGVIRRHPLEFAGKSVEAKLNELREILHSKYNREEGKPPIAYGLISTALDEIAYIFNLRGSDIPCNPVAISYGLITLDDAYLFIDKNKFDLGVENDVYKSLENDGVKILPYDDIFAVLNKMTVDQGHHIWMDGRNVNCRLYHSISSENVYDAPSPIILMKALKNKNELAGMKACHLRDGAAMAEFFANLEDEILKDVQISEYDIDEMVCYQRSKIAQMMEPSFPTIAGIDGNGAIIHYKAMIDSCKYIKPQTNTDGCMILLDSGGQYEDGTTDVTRTFHTGIPTTYQKEMFTRVLKGNIAIDTQIFPVGTPGCQLDSFARRSLWCIGKDYIHGTGHGVGAALNVHEGPHRISRMIDNQPLKAGMIVSNEPGYYEEDNFGIRIENLLIVIPRIDKGSYAGREFLGFEKLTHIPIQHKCLEFDLLTNEEIKWLDVYHKEIHDKVLPYIQTNRAKQWLIENTITCAEYIQKKL